MSFERFMKKNKIQKKNTFYPATASLCDEEGKPLEWEIRPLSTKETEQIREKFTYEVPIPGKKGMYREKVSNDYIPTLICNAVVCPNLNDAELQDSYEVKKAQDLLFEMIDDPAEFNNFVSFVMNYSGIDTTMDEEIEEAKNS